MAQDWKKKAQSGREDSDRAVVNSATSSNEDAGDWLNKKNRYGPVISESGFKSAYQEQEILARAVQSLDEFTTQAQLNAKTVYDRLNGYHDSVKNLHAPLGNVKEDVRGLGA